MKDYMYIDVTFNVCYTKSVKSFTNKSHFHIKYTKKSLSCSLTQTCIHPQKKYDIQLMFFAVICLFSFTFPLVIQFYIFFFT